MSLTFYLCEVFTSFFGSASVAKLFYGFLECNWLTADNYTVSFRESSQKLGFLDFLTKHFFELFYEFGFFRI